MATEAGEPQGRVPEAAALPAPKQVKPEEVRLEETPKGSISTSCQQTGDGGASQASFSEDSPSHLSSGVRVTRSPARNPLSFRMMQAKVTLLDGSLFTCTVEVRHLKTGETGGETHLLLPRLKPVTFP